jgi:glycosyltransferase involved in cell wall biosynthesis
VLEGPKALDILLDAWPRVVSRLPEAKLTMVGDGSLRGELERRVRDQALGGSVEMRSPVAREAVRELLDGSTCLVLPSRSEGLPRVLFEAMARGRAVVATKVGGIAELVDDGVNGRLVDPDDATALADALVDVLGDRRGAARMGESGRHEATARDPLREYEDGMARMATWIRGPG